jgi:Arc/MetJ-type ribon-helix-helix transcriptional regulator
MIKVLKEALDEVEALPEADQERIGRELLEYVQKLRALRADLQEAAASLDRGEGRELDMDDVIRRARARHAKSQVEG